MRLANTAYFLITAILVVGLLIVGQSIIVPFLLGLLLWFIMRGLKMTLDRIPFVKRKFPSWLKGLLSAGIIIFCLSLVFDILTSNINELTHSYNKYEPNIDYIIKQINQTLGLDLGDYGDDFIGSDYSGYDYYFVAV